MSQSKRKSHDILIYSLKTRNRLINFNKYFEVITMKQDDQDVTSKAIEALHEMTRVLSQAFSTMNEHRILKSANGESTNGEIPTYKYVKTERLSQKVTRETTETYSIGSDGYLVLISREFEDREIS
jgi:hypothetical protein